jgi:hypothetical protein
MHIFMCKKLIVFLCLYIGIPKPIYTCFPYINKVVTMSESSQNSEPEEDLSQEYRDAWLTIIMNELRLECFEGLL